MAKTVKVEGLRELEAALHRLPRAVGKRFLRNALREMGKPIAEDAQAKAPRESGALIDSIGVGTRLNKSQRGKHRRMFRDDRASMEVFVGPSGLPQSVVREFGTYKLPAQPYMRPAWDGNKGDLIPAFTKRAWEQIEKRAAREARKAARLAKKMGG